MFGINKFHSMHIYIYTRYTVCAEKYEHEKHLHYFHSQDPITATAAAAAKAGLTPFPQAYSTS